MRKLLVGLVISACMFAFAGCKEDKEEAEENVKQGNTSVTYYLVGNEDADYYDILIIERDKEYDVIDQKKIEIISGENPVRVQSEKGCTNITIVYRHRYIYNDIKTFRRYRLNEKEFQEEKNSILLALGETIEEEDYYTYFSQY